MPDLELMPWDSRTLGLNAARVVDVAHLPEEEEMAQYDLILARLPMDWIAGRERYQAIGFDFVTIDLSLTSRPTRVGQVAAFSPLPLVWLRRQPPSFRIDGFVVEASRLMRDSRCRRRLPVGFWDAVIAEHCSSFADIVACAVDPAEGRLAGMISCIEREREVEMFLVAVNPDYQSRGIGKQLLAAVEDWAIETGRSLATQVLETNVRAMRLYFDRGFAVDSGEVVMHRWNERLAQV